MKTSIFMSEEVKEQVRGRGKGEMNGLKGRQRRCRQGPSRSCLFPQKDSCRISAELRVLTLPAGLDKLWHQVGEGRGGRSRVMEQRRRCSVLA